MGLERPKVKTPFLSIGRRMPDTQGLLSGVDLSGEMRWGDGVNKGAEVSTQTCHRTVRGAR